MQNIVQFGDGILVNRVGTVYEWVEIVTSPPVRIHGWVTLAALHKIVPLLWVCEAVLQKSLDQFSNIRSCTIAAHMTYPKHARSTFENRRLHSQPAMGVMAI